MMLFILFVICVTREYVLSDGTTTPHPIAGPSQGNHETKHGSMATAQQELSFCRFCSNSYQSSEMLIYHMQYSHPTECVVSCELCGRRFTHVKYLKLHRKYHENKKKTLSCSICSKTFEKASKLSKHEQTHVAKQLFRCETCGANYKTEWMLKKHARMLHSNEIPFTCRICKRIYTSKSMLMAHLRDHGVKTPLSCKLCNTEFSDTRGLDTHMEDHHNMRPVFCGLCGKKFLDENTLKHHVETHSGEQWFVCKICGNEYKQHHDLNTHMNYHEAGQPRLIDLGDGIFDGTSELTGNTIEGVLLSPLELGESSRMDDNSERVRYEVVDSNSENGQNIVEIQSNPQYHTVLEIEGLNRGNTPANANPEVSSGQRPEEPLESICMCSCQQYCETAGENSCVFQQIHGPDQETSRVCAYSIIAPDYDGSFYQPTPEGMNTGTFPSHQEAGMIGDHNLLVEDNVGIDYESFILPNEVSNPPQILNYGRRMTLEIGATSTCEEGDGLSEELQGIIDDIMRRYHESQKSECEGPNNNQVSER